MQSPMAVATLKQLKDGRPHAERHHRRRYGLAALIALAALGAIWTAIANDF